MTPLRQLLAATIHQDGPLPVSRYMAEAMTHPDHGYYRTRDPLGRGGDFTTAPEISQMFGELIGGWCAQTWAMAGGPAPVQLVELGPGRGTLMADALRTAAKLPTFRSALSVWFVDINPALRDAQAAAVPEAHWADAVDQVPDGPSLFVANEFFDALPVRQLLRRDDGWCERLVGVDGQNGALCFVAGPPLTSDDLIPPPLRDAPVGAIVEVCPTGTAIMAMLAQRVVADGIAALVIDYGHARPGTGETLQAVRDHSYQPVLADPGEADLTAHVDFHALAETARGEGAAVHGPVTQGAFLKRLGIDQRAEVLAAAQDADGAKAVEAARQRLTGEDAMGTLFKVMAITRADAAAPAGFEAAA